MNTHIMIQFDPENNARIQVEGGGYIDYDLAKSLATTLVNRKLQIDGRLPVAALRNVANVYLGKGQIEYHFVGQHND
jgi:hypothetical protein